VERSDAPSGAKARSASVIEEATDIQHGGDMIAALQGSVYKDGKELTNRDIAHMMIAILMAGQHTSSATSSWTLLHIAHRPDVA
jgi:sterol 14-demethylase